MDMEKVEVLENDPNYVVLGNGRNSRYLWSYKTLVAARQATSGGKYINVLYPGWNTSRTTMKHLERFLELAAVDIRKSAKECERIDTDKIWWVR